MGSTQAATANIWDGTTVVGTVEFNDDYAAKAQTGISALTIGQDAATALTFTGLAGLSKRHTVMRRWQWCRIVCICGSTAA
ncbi:hypothetical protein CspHIS471_0500030 [Cutaneotrichosporon sp. HIS471]|nr:hypothetical protein CspHIS471_0500030 [Cutaneotrichosporon sp. HIS471]